MRLKNITSRQLFNLIILISSIGQAGFILYSWQQDNKHREPVEEARVEIGTLSIVLENMYQVYGTFPDDIQAIENVQGLPLENNIRSPNSKDGYTYDYDPRSSISGDRLCSYTLSLVHQDEPQTPIDSTYTYRNYCRTSDPYQL